MIQKSCKDAAIQKDEIKLEPNKVVRAHKAIKFYKLHRSRKDEYTQNSELNKAFKKKFHRNLLKSNPF